MMIVVVDTLQVPVDACIVQVASLFLSFLSLCRAFFHFLDLDHDKL